MKIILQYTIHYYNVIFKKIVFNKFLILNNSPKMNVHPKVEFSHSFMDKKIPNLDFVLTSPVYRYSLAGFKK